MKRHQNLGALADAPPRFQTIHEDHWIGSPSVAYGSVRKLAHHWRKSNLPQYVRIFFGDGGRRGDPWGGLGIEVNGEVYHFHSGIEAHTEFHDGHGGLTGAGINLLATGLPGKLHNTYDWRWMQAEVDITPLLTTEGISRVAQWYNGRHADPSNLPIFQSQMWARRLGKPLIGQNCTSSIVSVLNEAGLERISGWYPLTVFTELKQLSGGRSPLEDSLNFLLWQDEPRLMDALTSSSPNFDWNAYAKGKSSNLTPDIGLSDLMARF